MEEKSIPRVKLPRNPDTHAKHRREVFWQIIIPLGVGILLVLGLAGGLILLEVRDVSVWADISLIWLIAPALFGALIPLAVLVAMIYLLVIILRELPPYATQAQQLLAMIESRVKEVADRVVEPILRVHSSLAGVRSLRRK